MKYYFLFLGLALLTTALALLFSRLWFIRTARRVKGHVIGEVIRDFDTGSEGGKSKHLKIHYVDNRGNKAVYIADNSLLTSIFSAGEVVELFCNKTGKSRILINHVVAIYSPSFVIALLGLVALYLYWDIGP